MNSTPRIAQTREEVLEFLESRRMLSAGITMIVALELALLVVVIGGEEFTPVSPVSAENNLGTAQAIRMPIGARRKEDIKSFIVRMDGVDDYGRVFVNNYLALTNEDPEEIFYTNEDPEKKGSSCDCRSGVRIRMAASAISFLLCGQA